MVQYIGMYAAIELNENNQHYCSPIDQLCSVQFNYGAAHTP